MRAECLQKDRVCVVRIPIWHLSLAVASLSVMRLTGPVTRSYQPSRV